MANGKQCTLRRMAEPLRIVFCGTPAFAVPSLQALLEDQSLNVHTVITQPDKPVGRSQEMCPPPVKLLAENHGIPVLQPEDINAHAEEIAPLQPDFIVVVAYGQLLKPALLTIPSIAPVNVHPSLLPRWRGASPIQHALLAGDSETGVTIQHIVERLDAGPILAQERTAIEPRETAQTLHDRLSVLGASLLVRTLKEPLHPHVQEERDATQCTKLTRSDGIADPREQTAEEIDRHVRALVPWPGVRCRITGEEVKLLATELDAAPDTLPLPCAQGTTLFVRMLQSPGKRPMSGAEWQRGHRA